MKHHSKLFAVCALALLMSVPAFGQTPEVSTLPVDQPINVGGTILQPGVYQIKVIPALGDRNRVQITSTDGTQIYATLLTVPHDLEPNEEVPMSRFVYFPSTNGQPRVLRTWFPPNSAMDAGHDIVYEEGFARQLAAQVNEPLPTYRGEITETTEIVRTEPVVVETQTTVTTPTIETRTETTTPMTSSVQTAEVEMPRTAGEVPMIALFGLLAVVAAVGLRFARGA